MPESSPVVHAALETLGQRGLFAAIDYLGREADSKQVLHAYGELVHKLYWESHDLPGVVAIATAGIGYALHCARTGSETALTQAALASAKKMSYNLASFTWPGWAEPGIDISPAEARLGLEAARLNLALTAEFELGTFAPHRAHWMLGAHELAAGMRVLACDHFEQSARLARAGEHMSESLLAIGFLTLARLLDEPENEALHRDYVKAKLELANCEDGAFYVNQLDTAWNVFAL